MRSSLLRGTGDCRLLWDGIVKHVLLLSLFLFGMCLDHARVNAFLCPSSCDKSACPEPTGCPRGKTLDVCGCCEVCGLDLNATCGGPFGVHGRCGEGLECALSSEVGGRIRGSAIGICRGKSAGGLLTLVFRKLIKIYVVYFGIFKTLTLINFVV